ncbi:MAG: dihydroneopterin aldolase [Aeromicrobium sp.]|uniref:dihydroneopterin aldolase n=1 Tax=Aeromicrobium sp. TaxID=1871063 RepID=UPI0025B8ADDB|nr:dihydroneopterin aldolase [Aeromicrobium sp.]MCK5891998.1 dihydroneopterin aldolase [Aeromicrobium sp.]MDF1704342.1 dihydroneopterin aldolase [Aeromicrobium sp.]
MTIPDGLDRIELTGLRGFGHHGVFDHERRDGQEFVVDAVLGLDLTAAGRTDDLAETVHYGELADGIHAILVGPPVDLIESLALRMVDLCLTDARVQWASVTVHKPNAPITPTFTDVAVTIERSRQ